MNKRTRRDLVSLFIRRIFHGWCGFNHHNPYSDRVYHIRILGQPAEPTRCLSYGGGIENLDTMAIPHSGYSAAERRAEYIRRVRSPSGVIDGVYNDTYRPSVVSYNVSNRDWDADA
jgi:hypothetical protein